MNRLICEVALQIPFFVAFYALIIKYLSIEKIYNYLFINNLTNAILGTIYLILLKIIVIHNSRFF